MSYNDRFWWHVWRPGLLLTIPAVSTLVAYAANPSYVRENGLFWLGLDYISALAAYTITCALLALIPWLSR